MQISIFWFRRDLRLENNTALNEALNSGHPVLPIFIFDQHILQDLPEDDPRLGFIHSSLGSINEKLNKVKSSMHCLVGDPLKVWEELIANYEIANVFTNKDYEPYAIKRDEQVKELLTRHNIQFQTFKDQVVFEENEVLKDDGKPYTVFTPYKNKWLKRFNITDIDSDDTVRYDQFLTSSHPFPTLSDIGFKESPIKVKDFDLSQVGRYALTRNFPTEETSNLSPHLRFGTVSVRQIIAQLKPSDETFLSELIWREFFMQILFHFPDVMNHNFKRKYDGVVWRNNEEEFEKWCEGKTGYPMVDAGMRQLNKTGYMHNRVRMVVAGFLCKHLLIDWQWGEAYFAQKLLDYELSSNNGNWQWAAGTGCDAAPYFRIFNPIEQLKKFDKELIYVRKWIPEFDSLEYALPMVDHKLARQRALERYKSGLLPKHN
jgi:deoxyribodipyrimidine photo-lyase